MLLSPEVCVLGTNHLGESVAFWSALGFVEGSRSILQASSSRELYGIDHDTNEVLMEMPGSSRGHVRLVETPVERPTIGPFDRGPYAIDLYTTDLKRSLSIASQSGASTSSMQLDYAYGDLRLREGKCLGPDGVVIVFVDISRRRPSLLDHEPDRLHSEVHSVVNIVHSVDAANATWKAIGLTIVADAVLDTPELAAFMALPTTQRCRMSLLADDDVSPIRFEQLGFVDGGSEFGVDVSAWPLPAGLGLVEFRVASSADDLSGSLTTLTDSGHTVGPRVDTGDSGWARWALDGTGQRYFLRN